MTRLVLSLVATLLPAVAVLLLAVALNLPWPIDPAARAALPFLVLPVIHATAARAPERLPAPALLVAGLLADVVAGTPLGYSALLYLGVLGSTLVMRRLTGGRVWGQALSLPAAALAAIGIATLVPLAFTLQRPDFAPILAGNGLGFGVEAVTRLTFGILSFSWRAAARGSA